MAPERCVLDECERLGSYYIGWEEYGAKGDGIVCATHDRQIGRRSLAKWKPWMKHQEIVDWDNQFCRRPDWRGLEGYVYSIDPSIDSEWDE